MSGRHPHRFITRLRRYLFARSARRAPGQHEGARDLEAAYRSVLFHP
jgi:hypothetical protein